MCRVKTSVGLVERIRSLSGFSLILIATIVSGVASYVVTSIVFRQLDAATYAVFAIFWSFLYLVVGALFGIQQEVTRGTREVPAGAPARVSRARNFGLVAGVTVFVVIVASAPLWVDSAFPGDGWALVWPLAVGAASFVMVAVLCGSLYGISGWVPLALLMITDSFLRLIGIVVVLAVTDDTVALAWAVALPFPGALVILWPFIRRTIVGRTQLDVGYRAVTWNVARTMVAAASTGIMVSGFPLVLQFTSSGESAALVGLYVFCITLTRAPLIVIAMSLQSYLIVVFRDAGAGFWRLFLRLQGVLVAAGIVLAAGVWWLGPPLFEFLFPDKQVPDGAFLAALIASSALVGSLCVSAPAVLARSEHVVYAAGWVVSAIVTVCALLLPVDFTTRTVLSLLVGPAAGILLYGGYLLRVRASGRVLVPADGRAAD
jgi:O-antigen/teichoic acid export membrane protein